MKYAIKIGNLYVHYIMLKERENYDEIQEVLLRPQFLRKFKEDEARIIASKLNGEILKEKIK